MATSKTLTPTNVTISIPEFTDQPDQRVNSNCIDKEADAINDAYSKLTPIVYPSFLNGKSAIETFIRNAVSSNSRYACAFINNTSKDDAITQGFNTSGGYLEIMEHNSMYADHPYFRFYAQNSFGFGRLNVTSSSITAEVFNDFAGKFTNKMTVLGWDTYENGTYNMVNVPTNGTLCRIWIGSNNHWGELRCYGSAGDAWKFYTQDGVTTVTFSATQVTVSNAGANSKVRSITAYPGFVFT